MTKLVNYASGSDVTHGLPANWATPAAPYTTSLAVNGEPPRPWALGEQGKTIAQLKQDGVFRQPLVRLKRQRDVIFAAGRVYRNPHLKFVGNVTHDDVVKSLYSQSIYADFCPPLLVIPQKHRVLTDALQGELNTLIGGLGVRSTYNPRRVNIRMIIPCKLDALGTGNPFGQHLKYRSGMSDMITFVVLAHELIHCASGALLFSGTYPTNNAPAIIPVHAGLKFAHIDQNFHHRWCFLGMDEALTEIFSKHLLFNAWRSLTKSEKDQSAGLDLSFFYSLHIAVFATLVNAIADEGGESRVDMWRRSFRCYITGETSFHDDLLSLLGKAKFRRLSAVTHNTDDAVNLINTEPRLARLKAVHADREALTRLVWTDIIPYIRGAAGIS